MRVNRNMEYQEKKNNGIIVKTISFLGREIRVVKCEDKFWFVSADLRKALGILHGGRFCEKAPEEMKRDINIKGHKKLKRIISPEGLKTLAKRAVRGKIYGLKLVINEFVDNFKKGCIKSVSEEVKFSLSEIVVSDALLNTRLKEKKIQKVKDYYKEHGEFEKLFVVNKKNLNLLETYTQYIAAKELGLEEVVVRFKL